MTFSNNIIAPGIYLYDKTFNFSQKIIDLCTLDKRSWTIRNQDASTWQEGNKIIGYDEYPVSFSFNQDGHFLLLAKNIFDYALNYSVKNLTTIDGFDLCTIRKYSSRPGFLEIESPDVENPLRKITAILFLNNVKNGGEINFKNFDVSIAAEQGSIVVFPASFAYAFKINKPKESESLVVVSHFV